MKTRRKIAIVILGTMACLAANAQYAPSASGSSTAAAEINGKPNWQTSTGACSGLNGTVGKDFCTDTSTGFLYAPSVTGTPATWVRVPAGAAATAAALAGTPSLCSSGNAPTGILANGNATGCASISGGSSFVDFVATGGTISNNGTDVAVYSFAAPALPAGKCYYIAGEVNPVNGAAVKILVDSTPVTTVFSNTGSNNNLNFVVHYCNQTAVQNAQYLLYPQPPAYGVGTANVLTAAYSGDSGLITPTAVDWSSGHTIKITTNVGSGNTTGIYALIYMH